MDKLDKLQANLEVAISAAQRAGKDLGPLSADMDARIGQPGFDKAYDAYMAAVEVWCEARRAIDRAEKAVNAYRLQLAA